jgi:hypothetical protein
MMVISSVQHLKHFSDTIRKEGRDEWLSAYIPPGPKHFTHNSTATWGAKWMPPFLAEGHEP